MEENKTCDHCSKKDCKECVEDGGKDFCCENCKEECKKKEMGGNTEKAANICKYC